MRRISDLTGHNVGRDEERDPRDDHEQAGGEVVRDDVGHDVPSEILKNQFKFSENSFERSLNLTRTIWKPASE